MNIVDLLKKPMRYICRRLQIILKSHSVVRSNIYPEGISNYTLNELTEEISRIPGMITNESGQFLFIMAFAQQSRGDIVEIGSWQGKSTIFLAKAALLSGNGRVYAVDHFKGNVGKERFYIVRKRDLSDLREGFLTNIKSFGLENHVTLLDMTSSEASAILKKNNVPIRLLFIDGSHEYDDVKADFLNFIDLVIPDGQIVFDDYSENFPGVVRFVHELIRDAAFSRYFCCDNTFVAKK